MLLHRRGFTQQPARRSWTGLYGAGWPRLAVVSSRKQPRGRCDPSATRPVAANSRQPGNDAKQRAVREEDVEDQGEACTRFIFEGILSSALIVGVANLFGQSDNWNWAMPEGGVQTMLACALPSSLLLLAICVPAYSKGSVATNESFLEEVYDNSSAVSVVVVGRVGEEAQRMPSLTPVVGADTLSEALGLLKVFLYRPWVLSQPLASAGFLLKQTFTQAAVECLVRGTLVFTLRNNIKMYFAQADAGSWQFWPKVLGLSNESNFMPMAVVLTTLLLTPMTLLQAKQMQKCVRAAVNKPIQDGAVAAMQASTSVADFARRVRSLSETSGADAGALKALLEGEQPIMVVASRGRGQQDAAAPPPRAAAARDDAGTPSTSKGSGTDVAPPLAGGATLSLQHVSKDTSRKLQSAEQATVEAFASLKAARTPAEVEAASLVLLGASSSSAEAALGAMVEAGSKLEQGESSEKVLAATAALLALKSSQRRLQAASEADEALGDDSLGADQFATLLMVETPHDRLVNGLMGTQFMSAMVAVNVAFLATGSLAVSLGTAWITRILPFMVIEIARHLEQGTGWEDDEEEE